MTDFTFIFKKVTDLTQKEIDQMFELNVKMYPEFSKVYKVNKYYSYVKPQKIMMVYSGDRLIADANYAWRKVFSSTENKNKKFSYFGILVDDAFQNQGIGKSVILQFQEETKKMESTGLFATTQEEAMKHLFEKFDFHLLKNKLIWFNSQINSHQKVSEEGFLPYWWAANEGDWLETEPIVFLGTGPI